MAKDLLSGKDLLDYFDSYDSTLPESGGQKEFAPDGSWIQGKRLQVFYRNRSELLKEPRLNTLGNIALGTWIPEVNMFSPILSL